MFSVGEGGETHVMHVRSRMTRGVWCNAIRTFSDPGQRRRTLQAGARTDTHRQNSGQARAKNVVVSAALEHLSMHTHIHVWGLRGLLLTNHEGGIPQMLRHLVSAYCSPRMCCEGCAGFLTSTACPRGNCVSFTLCSVGKARGGCPPVG